MIKTKKTNKSIYKQTNKQTNKHFIRSYISQLNKVRSSRNVQGIFLWVSQDDLNKKQINKKTNKQINIFLDLIYLSQIKSDLHKTCRETSYECPTLIKTKNKLIIKNKHFFGP